MTRRTPQAGFTLIEVMITVAIIAILASIAIPSYRDYVLRGQLVDATNGLAAFRANMERYYQDNRRYDNVVGPPAFTSPCGVPVAQRTFGKFVIDCSTLVAQDYMLRATGSGSTNGFVFTLNPQGQQTTVAPTGWGNSTTCWVLKRGQVC